MPRKSNLAVVEDGPPATEGVQQSIRAAARGSERELLVALRDRIAADLDEGVPARDLASLSKRLMEVSAAIRAIDASEEGDDVGDAAATPDESFTPS